MFFLKNITRINLRLFPALIIFPLLLTGCFWDQKQKSLPSGTIAGSYTNKTYLIDRLEGSGHIAQVEGLSQIFTLELGTCITDSQKQETSVPNGTEFIIEYETAKKSGDSYKKITRRISVKANERGCILWSERYPYRYVFKKRWIGLRRVIEGSDGTIYHGKEVVETAVNPWIFETDEGDEFPSVIDRRPLYYDQNAHILQRYPFEPEGLDFLIKDSLEYPQLWVENIGLQMRFAQDQSNRSHLNLQNLIKSYTTLCGFDEKGNRADFIEGESLCFNRKLIMDLTIPLQILTLGVKGKVETKSIEGGDYNIKAYLVAQPQGSKEDEYYLLHREKFLEKRNVSSGHSTEGTYQSTEFLTVEFPVDILFGHFNADYKLMLEIENNEGLFKRFEGVYTLGDKIKIGTSSQDIKNDNWLLAQYKSLYKEKDFQIGEKAIDIISSMEMTSLFNGREETQKEMIKRLKQMGFHVNWLEVEVKDGEIRYANVKSSENCSESENVIERTIEYSVTACFEEFFEKPPERIPFKVIIEDPSAKNPENRFKEIRKKTEDENGPEEESYFTRSGACIKIYNDLYHKNYNRQIYTERKIHYISEDGQFYGQAHVGLNPWQGQFQFGKDLTTASGIRTKRDGVPFPSLVINQFRAVNFYPSYLIDKFLNIHISHNYYFLFQVIIARHDNIEHGRHPMGREFIRDGYYLTRILIMRNPLETNAVKTVKDFEKDRKEREEIKFNESMEPSFVHGGEYLSHVDTVINVRGNWVNIYVPTQFDNQQFIYLASRNQIAIQVLPADPREFVYREQIVTKGKTCELDLKKTKWKPYFDCKTLGKSSLTSDDCHELEIMPHTAPMQTNDWMNWNVLRRAPLLNTDKIIDQSELGKRRKFFTFHPEKGSEKPSHSEVAEETDKPVVRNAKEGQCPIEPYYPITGNSEDEFPSGRRVTDSDINECFGDQKRILKQGDKKDFEKNQAGVTEKRNNQMSETEQIEENEERDILPSILRQFAEDNALKVVDLSDPEQTQKLVSDLNETGAFFEIQAKAINTLVSQKDPETERKVRPSHARGFKQKPTNENIMDELSLSIEQFQDRFGPETFEELKQKIQTQCLKTEEIDERSFWDEPLSYTLSSIEDFFTTEALNASGIDPELIEDFVKYYNECSKDLIRSELERILEGSETEDQNRDNTPAIEHAMHDALRTNTAAQIYDPSSTDFEEFSKKIALLIVEETEKDKLESIVDEGVTTTNYKNPKIGSFIHNLCNFWFKKYFSEYLTGKQMVVAYTNFIKKFDYNEILESRDMTYSNFDVNDLFKLHTTEEDGPGKCVKDYTSCLLNVRCSSSDDDQINRTCQYAAGDNNCTVFLQNNCQFPEEANKRPCSILKSNVSESQCQKDMSTYCLQNSEQKFCLRYNNRCFVNQQNCLKGLENWFDELRNKNAFGLSATPEELLNIPPLKTCLANPFEFFRFERKMAVLELDKNSFEYVRGLPFSTSISSSHSISSGLRWSGQAATSISLGPSVNLDSRITKGNTKVEANQKRRNKFSSFDFGVRLMSADMKMGMTSSTSNDAGKDLSIRVLEGVYLNVHQSVIKMGVKKFKRCLVVKPRPNAFFSYLQDNGLREEYKESFFNNSVKHIQDNGLRKEYKEEEVWDEAFHGDDMKKVSISRPGLLICNPIEEREEDNPETIKEYYYYLAQELSRNMEFMFLYDIRNRPFTMLFRGQAEFFKYFSLMRELRGGRDPDGNLYNFKDGSPLNFFARYSYPIEEVVGLNYAIRALNETGFQPGIYTYPDRDWLNSEFYRKESSWPQRILEKLDKNNIFRPSRPSGMEIPVQIWAQ